MDKANAQYPSQPINPGLTRIALLTILLVAAALRFYALDASSLWSDEGNTFALIQRPFDVIARDAAADIHPPGYYWLLKVWTILFGAGAAAMRSFSALAGVALVAIVYAIGRRLDAHTANRAHIALSAAVLAALNPFQLYYSQEARMYMLLALAGAGLFSALITWIEHENRGASTTAPLVGFVVCGAAGLWIHYSFPILLGAAGLAYLWHWRTLLHTRQQPLRTLTRYILANLAILLAFGVWLPTAITRVQQWPRGDDTTALGDGIVLTLRTLAFGPMRTLPDPLWPWLSAAAVLALLGMVALLRLPVSNLQATATFRSDSYLDSLSTRSALGVTLALWMLAPVMLMFGLGLFGDAFLKFLLSASPAWTLLCASAPLLLPMPRWGAVIVAAGGIALAASVLPFYYTSPTVRDNYAGVAEYIRAVGDPTHDIVILDAPGQRDVWSYYASDLPTLDLPANRPPDPAATIAQLEAHVQNRRQAFALFWATDEADPDRLVETWLDQHGFRGLESWQGNLRFVVYSIANQLDCIDLAPPVTFGDSIQLVAHCRPATLQRIPGGQVGLLGLQWQTRQPLAARYKVTVQLLDARNQVIAQHDAEPAGGSRPTDSWEIETRIVDNHALTVPFGAPPGTYRLIIAIYDAANGQRLPTPAGDAFVLGDVEVIRPEHALPLEIIPMQQRANAPLGPVILVGYDAYKKDHSFAPETPLQAGDTVHFTLYWQAPNPLPVGWPADLAFGLTLGEQTVSAPLAGGAFPTSAWQPGEFIRGEFDLPYDGSTNVPLLRVGEDSYRLRPLPR